MPLLTRICGEELALRRKWKKTQKEQQRQYYEQRQQEAMKPTVSYATEEIVEVEVEDVRGEGKSRGKDERQNRRHHDNLLCCICLDNKKEVLLAPCGHYRYCGPCAYNLQERGLPCSICKQRFHGIIKVYD